MSVAAAALARVLALVLAAGLAAPAAAQQAPDAAPAAEADPAAAGPATADEAAPDGADDEPGAAETEAALSLADPAIDPRELEIRVIPLTAPEIEELAAAWLAIVRAKSEEVADRQVAILRGEGEAADEARARFAELAEERRQLFDRYRIVLDAWEAKGGDADAIASYRIAARSSSRRRG